MAVRFKKMQHVSLVNESEEADEDDYDVQIESDTANLISNSEDEAAKEHVAESRDAEKGFSSLSPDNTGVWRWNRKFWKRQRRYQLSHGSEESTVLLGREVNLCGHKCHLCRINSWKAIFLVLFVFSIAITISVIVSKLATEPPATAAPGNVTTTTPPPKPVTTMLPEMPTEQGAVVSDAAFCARLSAENILRHNGSAVDATITTMLCNGVVQPESSGLGGGGFMVIRLANGSVYTINFRETAPLAATEDMFHSNASVAEKGGLSIAVPGELKGMEKAHQLFGNLPWKELFDPVIALCREGFNLSQHGELALQAEWNELPENIKDVYRAEGGGIKKVGDLVTRPALAETLEAIAVNGTDAFYKDGKIAQSIVDTVNASGGIITLEDLEKYDVRMETPLQTEFNGHTFYSVPSPAGGATFLFILSLMEQYHHNQTSDPNLVYHRLVESFKFAFAQRTGLGDPYCNDSDCEAISMEINETQANMFNATFVLETWSSISDEHTFNTSHYHPHYYNPEDSGTSHISVRSLNGDAVAVTTTVNTRFGANLMTDTGIILNDEMDDFSAPNITNAYGLHPSEANFIRPWKRPLSSMCPTIGVRKTENGTKLFMIVGASGGSHIPTAVAHAVLRVESFGESISEAIESKRLHHQLLPDYVQYEKGFSQNILDFLITRGHEIEVATDFAVIQGVLLDDAGHVTAHADSRKQGQAVIVNGNT